MTNEEKIEIKKRYMDLITRLGYKIIYDLDKKCEDPVYDMKLLMTMRYPDEELYGPQVALRYIPFVVEKVGDLCFREFESYSKPNMDLGVFVVRINNFCMMNYSVNDLAMILLKNGVNLEDFHQFRNGKGRMILTSEGIRLIVDTLHSTGSPLENFNIRKKILGLK